MKGKVEQLTKFFETGKKVESEEDEGENIHQWETASRTMSDVGDEFNNKCECCRIYGGKGHIKRRENRNEPILGTTDQFCAAFYHVHEWRPHQHFCLDENRCKIAIRAKKEGNWNRQPKQVVALAKFEDKDKGNILYEARYSNCTQKSTKNHAEDFFESDIEDSNGKLNQLVQKNPNGTITLYITYQPCHMSIATNNTPSYKSCCERLEEIFTKILRAHGRKIDLRVKATHAYARLRLTEEEGKNEELRQNALKGIKNLMRIEGISISGMTHEDWDYLFSLTQCFSPRQVLDNDVKQTLNEINLFELLTQH